MLLGERVEGPEHLVAGLHDLLAAAHLRRLRVHELPPELRGWSRRQGRRGRPGSPRSSGTRCRPRCSRRARSPSSRALTGVGPGCGFGAVVGPVAGVVLARLGAGRPCRRWSRALRRSWCCVLRCAAGRRPAPPARRERKARRPATSVAGTSRRIRFFMDRPSLEGCLIRPESGLLASGSAPRLPGRPYGLSVAGACAPCGASSPGHSGGTAPASHRTSLATGRYGRGQDPTSARVSFGGSSAPVSAASSASALSDDRARHGHERGVVARVVHELGEAAGDQRERPRRPRRPRAPRGPRPRPTAAALSVAACSRPRAGCAGGAPGSAPRPRAAPASRTSAQPVASRKPPTTSLGKCQPMATIENDDAERQRRADDRRDRPQPRAAPPPRARSPAPSPPWRARSGTPRGR